MSFSVFVIEMRKLGVLCSDRCVADVYLKRWAADELSIHSPGSEESPPLKKNIQSCIIIHVIPRFIVFPF